MTKVADSRETDVAVTNSIGSIAVYRSHFLPDSETFIFNQIEALSKCEVRVLYRNRTNSDRFRLSKAQMREPSRASQFVCRAFRNVPKLNWRVNRWLFEAYLFRSLRRPPVDALLVHFGPDAMECLDAVRRSGVPMYVIFHGYDATQELASKTFEERYPGLIRSTTRFIAVSDFIRNELIRTGVPELKVQRHYLGIPISNTAPARAFTGTILQVGRLVQKKGHETTLRGFALARAAMPSLRLRIVGDGPLRAHLESLSDQLGISDCVTFVGALDQSGVHSELEQADIFVHPSETAPGGDAEGFGLAITEAMASGLPVVATRHGGIPEAVGDGGVLIEERDEHALSAALLHLSQDADYRSTIAERARAQAAKFDVSICVASLLEALKRPERS